MTLTRPYDHVDTILIDGKDYLYLNDDNPTLAYESSSNDLKFVAQPLPNKSDDNIVVVPLLMTEMWHLINNNIIDLNIYRHNNKIYDFNFVGQTHYANRHLLTKLNLQKYDFKSIPENGAIWSWSTNQKQNAVKNYLHRISNSKFVFCPRGIGSSSFRLFEAMAVGSVPIAIGMVAYPFETQFNWDEMCFRGDWDDLDTMINLALNLDTNKYQAMRQNCIKFWDQYCRHDLLHKRLTSMARERHFKP